MATIRFKNRGDFRHLEKFLRYVKNGLFIQRALNKYGQRGVTALSSATPVRSGRTAASWRFVTSGSNGIYRIEWLNDNVNDGVVIAILIQYGHGLPQGGYVQPTDFVNPTMKDVFQEIADDAWAEVTSA